MKRYLLFGGDHYYPNGGASDYHKDFDTLSEAQDYALNEREKISSYGYRRDVWAQIVDRDTMRIICWSEFGEATNEKTVVWREDSSC